MTQKLTIAVDASPLTSPLTGIGQYTYQILKNLTTNTLHQWILFIDKPMVVGDFNQLAQVKIICYHQKNKLTGTLWRWLILPKQLKRWQVDVFWSPCNTLPLLKNRKTHYVLTFHDMVHKLFPETMSTFGRYKARLLYHLALQQADHIITPSQAVANEITQFYPALVNKITAIWHGTIPTKQLTNLHQPHYPGCILFISTREPRKNIGRLIDAYLQLPETLKNTHPLVICGNPGWKSNITEKIKQSQAEKSVILTGYVNNNQLQAMLQTAGLFIMPSLYEGFGLPVIEAMQHGLPLILADIPVFREVAGQAALFVDPYDSQAMAEKITNVLTDAEQKVVLGKQAKQRGRYFAGWGKPAERTLAILEQKNNSLPLTS